MRKQDASEVFIGNKTELVLQADIPNVFFVFFFYFTLAFWTTLSVFKLKTCPTNHKANNN